MSNHPCVAFRIRCGGVVSTKIDGSELHSWTSELTFFMLIASTDDKKSSICRDERKVCGSILAGEVRGPPRHDFQWKIALPNLVPTDLQFAELIFHACVKTICYLLTMLMQLSFEV